MYSGPRSWVRDKCFPRSIPPAPPLRAPWRRAGSARSRALVANQNQANRRLQPRYSGGSDSRGCEGRASNAAKVAPPRLRRARVGFAAFEPPRSIEEGRGGSPEGQHCVSPGPDSDVSEYPGRGSGSGIYPSRVSIRVTCLSESGVFPSQVTIRVG